MTWSNEYRESIREREISREIDEAEIRCIKDVERVLLLLILFTVFNLSSFFTIAERLGNIERKVEITHEIDKWWILEEIFGDKK